VCSLSRFMANFHLRVKVAIGEVGGIAPTL